MLPPRERFPVSVRGSVLFGCEIIIAQILSPVKTVQKIFLRDFPAVWKRGSGGAGTWHIGALFFAAMGVSPYMGVGSHSRRGAVKWQRRFYNCRGPDGHAVPV